MSARAMIIAMTAALIDGGCTTVVKIEDKRINHPGIFKTLAVVWEEGREPIIQVSGRYGVTTSNRDLAAKGVGSITDVNRSGSHDILPRKLTSAGVCLASREVADAILTIRPSQGQGDCTILGCAVSVDFLLGLTDRRSKSAAWLAVIRSGANWPAPQDGAVSEDFHKTVAERLLETKLLTTTGCSTATP